MSFAWCAECLRSEFHPEPEWVLMYLYYEVGDHGHGLVEDEYLPGTWKDGRYWSWAEWRDWRRTQPDPFWAQPTIDSSAWTGRHPVDVSEVPKWLMDLAWPEHLSERPVARWRHALQVWLTLWYGWD